MASPRFQCLNTAKRIVKQPSQLKAAFSTSQSSQAPGEDLLSLLGESIAPKTRTTSSPSSQASFINPVAAGAARAQNRQTQDTTRVLQVLHSASIARSKREALQRQERAAIGSTDDLEEAKLSSNLGRMLTRRFKAGDVYAPHDLSGTEMLKWRQRKMPEHDVFDVLNFNPLDHYRNFSVMSEYMTRMGKIMHNKDTGLRPVNQRKIAKAIRRSIGMGMMPSVHRHPEILYKENMASTGGSLYGGVLAPKPM